MDSRTPEARRTRRVRAEELLQQSAKEENFDTSWVPHVAAAATNLAGAYVLFHEYKRYVPGWLSLASGTFVAEAQILTQPTAAIGAWNRYLGAFRPSGREVAARRFPVVWSVAPAFGGFVVRASF
jgi:hypothetical protein